MGTSSTARRVVDLPRNRPSGEVPFLIFCSLLCTFLMARLIVAGIYGGWWKLGGFLYVQGLHIHHYNYGIMLLSLVGFLSLTNLVRRRRWTLAILYGIGLGLTFDECAMWLRLEDNYYHRLSYDAVVAVALVFLLLWTFGAFRDRLQKQRTAKVRLIPCGTVLFHEGDEGHEAYYLLAGSVRISKRTPGGVRTLALIEAGEFVGEMALFADCRRSATAEAAEDLQVRSLDRKNLLYSLEIHPELGNLLIRTLAQRLVAANEHWCDACGIGLKPQEITQRGEPAS